METCVSISYLPHTERVLQMNTIKPYYEKVRAFFRAHRAARIAGYILAAWLLFVLIFHPKGTKTFLILGMDNYGSLNDVGRSDVMMLVQVDFTRAEISTVTFARDMFIPDENGRTQKINTIVRQSGEEALVTAMENAFQLDIDDWFRVNFTTVIELVDAIGGVHIDLTEKEARYINRNTGSYAPLVEGRNHLNGDQALVFARCRQLDNDMGRGERQNKVMAAMVAQTKRMTAVNVVNVFRSLKHAWVSSMSGFEQVRLLGSALWLRGAHVNSLGMPLGGWKYGNGGVVIKMEENVQLLHEALGLPAPKADAAR